MVDTRLDITILGLSFGTSGVDLTICVAFTKYISYTNIKSCRVYFSGHCYELKSNFSSFCKLEEYISVQNRWIASTGMVDNVDTLKKSEVMLEGRPQGRN